MFRKSSLPARFMYIRSRGLVINSIKYGDNGLIVHIFTEELGLQSFWIKGAKSPKNKSTTNTLQNLALVELDINVRSKGGLQSIKDVRLLHHYRSMHTEIEKHSIFVFITEVLGKSLQQSPKDASLFEFLFHALVWLDMSTEKCTDFHLIFLSKLSLYLGFHPGDNPENKSFFDLRNGLFVSIPPLHGEYLNEKQSHLFCRLLHSGFEPSSLHQFQNMERRQLLEILLLYYRIHLPNFGKIHSHKILHQVMH